MSKVFTAWAIWTDSANAAVAVAAVATIMMAETVHALRVPIKHLIWTVTGAWLRAARHSQVALTGSQSSAIVEL